MIPFGGSSVLGARGYAECGRELLAQAPDLATVVVAVGSGGTMVGLLDPLGSARVLGVHCGAVTDPARTVSELASGLTGTHCAPETLSLRLDQVGDGYSTLTEAAMAALTLTARTEGIVLDPIYTGRAMAKPDRGDRGRRRGARPTHDLPALGRYARTLRSCRDARETGGGCDLLKSVDDRSPLAVRSAPDRLVPEPLPRLARQPR